MSVSSETVHPRVRKLSTATCVVALLPIGMGALVTTLKAGMAFADWPSSDGHNMLLYPWFNDFASNPEKFTEHGHRLAGMLIGFISIALAVAGWLQEKRWVRGFVTAILVAVIGQGLLGGARVVLDKQLLAMLHSMTGACFFGLCLMFRLLCSPRWSEWRLAKDTRMTPVATALVFLAAFAVAGQYLLGGMLRHLHMMMNEHLLGAALASAICSMAAVCLLRSENSLLKGSGAGIFGMLGFQLLLGAGSYLTRFGLPMIGYVATTGSLSQAVVCSLHTVGGMTLFASTLLASTSLVQLARSGTLTALSADVPVLSNRRTAV